MATSTLRFALIVALVVGGVVLIGQAFPREDTSGLPHESPRATSPSPTRTPSRTPRASPSPQIAGVKIGVYNGAGVTGLAATTATKLEKKFGYVPVDVTDAPSAVSVTTIYYRAAKDKIEAEALASNFFKKLDVKVSKLPSSATNVKASIRVAIYLGSDYASTQG